MSLARSLADTSRPAEPGTLLRCLEDGARMLPAADAALTPRQLQGEMWVLLMEATEALDGGHQAVTRFLQDDLGVPLSRVSRWASKALFGEPAAIDDDEARELASGAVWEALRTFDPEFHGLTDEPIRSILDRHPPFWRNHPRLTARAHFVAVLKAGVKRHVAKFGIRGRLGTRDLNCLQVDRRAAERLSRKRDWVRGKREELGPDAEQWDRGFEDATLLIASLETIAKSKREREMLRLMAQAGPTYMAKDAYEKAGVSEKQFQAFQKRAKRRFPKGSLGHSNRR